MHTHDLDNHDNLYADEGTTLIGATNRDAQNHALLAIGAMVGLLTLLGSYLIVYAN
ncbi:hypothetical protein [Cyanobium sp. Morenito 9A2]|uniref:hypothetical protein n=1 Tax=Cyanobium sp. Morenito 9A2 TaxID=2823718 RepID=UPI0020CF76BD|nr:hypothetical protein [Cyanobium sp. Morenito 9A2]MCP9850152.1 hypothetical protein [Cyanobium sp. Morenito 9A2]